MGKVIKIEKPHLHKLAIDKKDINEFIILLNQENDSSNIKGLKNKTNSLLMRVNGIYGLSQPEFDLLCQSLANSWRSLCKRVL